MYRIYILYIYTRIYIKNYKNDSIVSVDMDKVSVMAAYI